MLPRASELGDPAVANVDQVLLVFALERPPLDLRGATRCAAFPFPLRMHPSFCAEAYGGHDKETRGLACACAEQKCAQSGSW